MATRQKGPAIGIDLGTTFSCVAVFRNGRVEIIPNEQGNRTTASYVAFTDTGHLVGDAAESQLARNPENTVFATKRLLGCRFHDKKVQSYCRNWPFAVVERGGHPRVKVQYRGETRIFCPEEISAMILDKMKEIAEAHIGSTVTDAVIAIPAHFNQAQRQAVKNAAAIAGINVLRIISEPIAAAMAYGLDKRIGNERNVLIFDMGGGTFNVSVVAIEEGVFEVKAVGGNNHLGGEDFDERMVNHFVQEFKQKHHKDITTNKRAVQRLRKACEEAKKTLSSCCRVSIEIDSLFEGIDFYTSITRVKFEELCADLLRSTLELVERALRDTKLDKGKIHDIVLTGKSTRIPRLQKLLQDFFNGRELNKSINADEAVAYGAAVQAAIVSGEASEVIQDLLLMDVAPLSLGIETAGGVMTDVIKKNSLVPMKEQVVFTTCSDNQTSFPIKVYEGERAMTSANNLLGEFELTGILPAPHGDPKIEVTLYIDRHYTINVSATDKSTGRKKGITITSSQLSAEDIKRMAKEAKQYKDADNKQRQYIRAKNKLEASIFSTKTAIEDKKDKISKSHRQALMDKCNKVMDWLDKNQLAEKEEVEYQEKEIKNVWNVCMALTLLSLYQKGPASGSSEK